MRLPDEDEKEFGKPQDSVVLSDTNVGTNTQETTCMVSLIPLDMGRDIDLNCEMCFDILDMF